MKKRRRKRKNFIEKIALPVNDDAKQLKKNMRNKKKTNRKRYMQRKKEMKNQNY